MSEVYPGKEGSPGQLTRRISSTTTSLRPARPGLGCHSGLPSPQRASGNSFSGSFSVEEELRAKCSELERVKKARKEVQDELKDAAQWGEKMLQKLDSKEKAWVEERERLHSELRKAKSSQVGEDILRELATSQAQAKAEALKAEAFQRSLVAARAALSRKAEEKAQATEAAAEQALKQEALEKKLACAEQAAKEAKAAQLQAIEAAVAQQETLEANLTRAEQTAREAKAVQLQAIDAAVVQQQSLEAALAAAQRDADAELKRRGTVEKEATSRQELLRSELAAALEERATIAAKHAAVEAAAEANTSAAQAAVDDARKEAENARSAAAAETAKAEAAIEAAKIEAAKAEAEKLEVEQARREAEAQAEAAKLVVEQARREVEDVREAAAFETARAEIAKAKAEAEMARFAASPKALVEVTPALPDACISKVFTEFDATEGSVASTMTPRTASPRTDRQVEETTDERCDVEMFDTEVATATPRTSSMEETTDEKCDEEVSDDEVATETDSHKDETDEVDLSLVDITSQCVSSSCTDGAMTPITAGAGAQSIKTVVRSAVIKDALRSAVNMLHFCSPDPKTCCASVSEPEAESSPTSQNKRDVAFKTLMSFGNFLGDIEKRTSADRKSTRKAPTLRQRRGGKGAIYVNCSPKNSPKAFKAKAAHPFFTSWWAWFAACALGVLVMLCALDSSGMLREDATRENSIVENPVRFDDFSISITSNALPALLPVQPRHALKLANQLMKDGQLSKALHVLLHAIEHLQGAGTRSTEDSAEILGAMFNNAGTLLVQTGSIYTGDTGPVDRAIKYYQQALKHLRDEEGQRYKVRLNLAAAEMMGHNWDACSREAQLASSESATLSDQPSQYVAQSLLSGCLFQNDAPLEKTLHEARVAMRLAPEDQLELARDNCQALEEAAARSVAVGRTVEKAEMKFAPTFKFLMPDL